MTRAPAPILWAPTPGAARATRLAGFARFAHERHGAPLTAPEGEPLDYRMLHSWSIQEPGAFWAAVWEFTEIIAEGETGAAPGPALVWPEAPPPAGFPEDGFDPAHRPRWFPEARLNFAENLLQGPDDSVAIVSWDEMGRRCSLSFGELRHETARFADALRAAGVGPGDRVAGFLPNLPETIIAFLGAATVGAIWSSCSPDFGTDAVVDRFGQIEPRVLVTADGYRYRGRDIDLTSRIRDIASRLPSLERVVRVPVSRGYAGAGAPTGTLTRERDLPGTVEWRDFLAASGPGAGESTTLRTPLYDRFPFDHPLAILYSSGTTGAPKCIVHSAGGTLLQHRKEHALHLDLKAGERFFYFTTCGWMMWNWLVTGLAEGATLILYDGSPMMATQPGGPSDMLWTLAEAERVEIFGTSARHLALMEKEGVRPGETRGFPELRTVLSTGSPLAPASFDWVYREVKPDLQLASISGGTDIISCFVLGVPTEPVRRGEIQGAGLGMAVEIRSPAAEGAARLAGSPGELVCARPFPSMPSSFWNDPGHERYRAAYFGAYSGVWRHGDWAEESASGGFIIHGRSDATLNPGGVRIGTADIYRQVEAFDEVIEAVAVEQHVPGAEPAETRIVLFVRLRAGATLDDGLEVAIRQRVREGASPHHVPEVVLPVPDIPRTISGKVSEIAVRDVVQGRQVANEEALENPGALAPFRDLARLTLPAPFIGLLNGLVDYAGLFPPAALPMDRAVANYAAYRRGPDRWALGRFVVPAARLEEFLAAAGPYLPPTAAAEGGARSADPWALSVLVGDEPGEDAERIRAFRERAGAAVQLAALEARVRTVEAVERLIRALSRIGGGAESWLEVPFDLEDAELEALLDSVQNSGAFAKLRTGGVTPELFPSSRRLLRSLRACAERNLRLKCTAGLHHPLHGDYRLTYESGAAAAPMYGYLNLLLAMAVLRAGGTDEQALAALEESDPASFRVDRSGLGWNHFRFGLADLAALRREGLAGFGSCSFREPVDEVVQILPRMQAAATRPAHPITLHHQIPAP